MYQENLLEYIEKPMNYVVLDQLLNPSKMNLAPTTLIWINLMLFLT